MMEFSPPSSQTLLLAKAQLLSQRVVLNPSVDRTNSAINTIVVVVVARIIFAMEKLFGQQFIL
jgi:hypothetical protein